MGEQFSSEKFILGFFNFKKVLWVMLLFAAFTYGKDSLLPKIKRRVETQNIETYVEATENKKVRLYGIKIGKLGLGVTYSPDE